MDLWGMASWKISHQLVVNWRCFISRMFTDVWDNNLHVSLRHFICYWPIHTLLANQCGKEEPGELLSMSQNSACFIWVSWLFVSLKLLVELDSECSVCLIWVSFHNSLLCVTQQITWPSLLSVRKGSKYFEE